MKPDPDNNPNPKDRFKAQQAKVKELEASLAQAKEELKEIALEICQNHILLNGQKVGS